MSVVGFEIDAEEWETLAEVTRRLLPSEPARVPGVVLEVGAERRRWTVQTPWLQVRLDGGAEAERPVAPVCVPTRLVAHASELAGMVGSCRLEVAERSLVVVNEVGSARFGAPGGVHLVRDPWAGRVVDARDAVAVVPVDQLVGALRSASHRSGPVRRHSSTPDGS